MSNESLFVTRRCEVRNLEDDNEEEESEGVSRQ